MGNRLMDAFSAVPVERKDVKKEDVKAVVNEVPVTAGEGDLARSKAGRPSFRDKTKITRTTTIKIYDEDFIYCRLRMKEMGKNQQNVSGFIAWLLEQDKAAHPEVEYKARKIRELEN